MSQNPIRLFPQHAEFSPNTPLDWFEAGLAQLNDDQRGMYWWIGDYLIALERQHPNEKGQALPLGMSPGLAARCKSVAEAYPPKDRNIGASWTTHMQLMKRGDRVAAVAATVEAGQTSDEVKKNPPPVQEPEQARASQEPATPAAQQENRWLLAVDMSYYVHSF